MKKILFLLVFVFSLFPNTYAASSFSHPVLQKAYEQVNKNILQKASSVVLDENSRIVIAQKKEQLINSLVAIDNAVKKRDKGTIVVQAKLFREKYKEIMSFIQEKGNSSLSENISQIQEIIENPEITGISSDITYYADSFEGRQTANGNTFLQSYYSAARCEIPFNTLLQVGNKNTSVIVKTNDRPNCSKYPNVTDLSKTAFGSIGKLSTGRLQGVINLLGTVPKTYTKQLIPVNTFTDLGVSLSSNLPNTYLKNETLHITGKELNGKDFIILYLKSPSGKDITLGAKKKEDGSFEYMYPLEEIGTYQMVIASGLSFNTNIFYSITVLEDSIFSGKKLISSSKNPKKLEKLEIERIELPDMTSEYLFHFSSSLFHTITIKTDKETFIYRGFNIVAIKNDALKSVDISKSVSVEVTEEESSTPFSHDTFTNPTVIFSKIMTIAPGYKEEKNENIIATEENGKLLIHGIIPKGKYVKNEIMLTLPDGNVEEYSFDPSSINTNGFLKQDIVFEKIITLKQQGLYLVEINYENGFAAYNGPITYGNILPIYPSNSDGIQKEINNSDASIVATESLKFVNNIRLISGKAALVLDDTLNNLATIKANDMALHDNLSHTDSYGNKIDGTAKRNNITITGAIGENIAGGNINFKLLLIGLANSGGHRANMLGSWNKMGVGYAVKNGQVYYSQVFGE